jgi:tripartite-type tricarboxylate transporter receptor subunit TctC
MRLMLRLTLAIISAIGASQLAAAQEYPSRPITIVIAFPAGGPQDSLIRTIQRQIEAALGQPLVIENRPGATGNIGNAYVAKAEPDGYTLLMTSVNMGMFPHVFPHLAYNPIKDFAAIGEVAENPDVCVVNSQSKINSFAELIKEAKATPGKITFGSSGNGSPSHLIVELIAKLNDVKLVHVPYKGPTLSLTDLMGNFITFTCTGLSSELPFIQQNQLRPLAILTEKRSTLLPNVPTMKELGLGDIKETRPFVLVAPARTPQPILDRLSTTLAKIVSEPSVKETFNKMGYETNARNPAEVSALIQEQYNLWGPFVRELKLKLE